MNTQNCGRHPNTIRKYTAALIGFFSNIEAESTDANGNIIYTKIPVQYATREKLLDLELYTKESLLNTNTNLIPRASISIESVSYDDNRQLNKTNNIAIGQNEILSTPAPYNISYRLSVLTRGMSNATMICEQICAFFKPQYNLHIYDGDGLKQMTEVRVKLDGVTFDPQEVGSYSTNEVLAEYEFTLYGNLFNSVSYEPPLNKIVLNNNQQQIVIE